MERLNQHVSFDGCVIMSSSAIHLTVPVSSVSVTLNMEDWSYGTHSEKKLKKLTKLEAAFLFFSSPSDLFSFQHIRLVLSFCTRILYQATHNNRMEELFRWTENRIQSGHLLSCLEKKLRRMWCSPIWCYGSIQNERPTADASVA